MEPDRRGDAGADPCFNRGDPFLRLGDGGLEVLQCQFQLCRIELLRLRAELCMPILPDLALQLPDQLLQFGDEGLLLGHYLLLVQPGGALHRQLELRGLECPNHLGRKVGILAEIKGLRHAPSYPIWVGKPNKTRPERTA